MNYWLTSQEILLWAWIWIWYRTIIQNILLSTIYTLPYMIHTMLKLLSRSVIYVYEIHLRPGGRARGLGVDSSHCIYKVMICTAINNRSKINISMYSPCKRVGRTHMTNPRSPIPGVVSWLMAWYTEWHTQIRYLCTTIFSHLTCYRWGHTTSTHLRRRTRVIRDVTATFRAVHNVPLLV